MDMNYHKYLKYRSKYLSLKKKIKNPLTGGADCPVRGYSQHRGECWHDALSTILLYSDDLSEHLQRNFDSDTFIIADVIETTHRDQKLKLFAPLNIRFPEDMPEKDFKILATTYIENLHTRYLNNKTEATDPIFSFGQFRTLSAETSITCAVSSKQVSNLNNIDPRAISDEKHGHGGDVIDCLINISVINYYLMNYNKLSTKYKYIYPNILTNKTVFNYPIDVILNELNKMKKNLIKCKGILINLTNSRAEGGALSGHVVGLVDCGKKQYFYDDNGVSKSNGIINYFEEFQWREYLTNKVDMLIKLLTLFSKIHNGIELLNNKLPIGTPIRNIGDLRLVLAGFFSWVPDINITNLDIDIYDPDVNLIIELTERTNINRLHSKGYAPYIIGEFVFINLEDNVNLNDIIHRSKYINNIADNYKYYDNYKSGRLNDFIIKSIESGTIPEYDLYYIFGNALNTQNIDLIDYILDSTKADIIRDPLNGNNLLHCTIDNNLVKIGNKKDVKGFVDYLKTTMEKLINKYPFLNVIPNNKKQIPILYLKSDSSSMTCGIHLYDILNNLLQESLRKYYTSYNIPGYLEMLKRSPRYEKENAQCNIET